MTTTNAFIFSWDLYGIESIIPISPYEYIDQNNLLKMLSGEHVEKNPLDSIIQRLLLRARFNTQRHYEIYAIDCDNSLDEEFWKAQWADYPQETAEIIRSRGHKLYSDRLEKLKIKIN